MARYVTAEIYDKLLNKGYRSVRLLNGIHVIDELNRMVAHYACPLGEDPYWDIWDMPYAPMDEEKLRNAYPLEGDILFQFSLLEPSLKFKQAALNERLSEIDITNQ